VAIIILTFSFSELFISGVEEKNGFKFWPDPGVIYDTYLIGIYLCLITYSLFLLWKFYKTESGVKKSSIKYIIIGSLLGFIGGATNFFLWYNIPIPPYGNILVFVYPVTLAFASFRYGLFNIKVIATELLIFSTWIFALSRTLISETLQDFLINGAWLTILIIFGIFIIRSVLKEVKTREEMEALAWKLEQANIKLKELDKAKSDFVTITSHQLRTPITAIKGYASMVLEGSFGAVPEKAKMAIDRIFQSSNRLVVLINDFLNLSRIERGKMEYVFAKVNLREILKTIFDEFKTINAKKKAPLDLSLEIAGKDDFNTSADSDKIRQTIYNLIDNAVKYTQNGFVKISLYKDAGKNEIIMKVEDSGKGMSKETLDNIFEKFSRAKDESKKYQVEGTGLGLYVAREIAKAHRGDVWAESAGLDKGSAFFMKLPIKNV
jgi:signal transduction histidine kinase